MIGVSLGHLRKSHLHSRGTVTQLSFWHGPGPVRKGRQGERTRAHLTFLAMCELLHLRGATTAWPLLVSPHLPSATQESVEILSIFWQFIFHLGALFEFHSSTSAILGLFSGKLGEVEAGTASNSSHCIFHSTLPPGHCSCLKVFWQHHHSRHLIPPYSTCHVFLAIFLACMVVIPCPPFPPRVVWILTICQSVWWLLGYQPPVSPPSQPSNYCEVHFTGGQTESFLASQSGKVAPL